MKRPTPSAAVGFATLIAFVLFLGFTFAIRGSLLGGAMELNVLFERVSGLEVGSPVYVAGVYAGQVTKISYQPQHMGKPVVVTLSLNKNFKFYQNAKVQIIQSGLIGDKRVEIDPGTPEYPQLSYGEAVNGEPQFDINQSLRQGQQIVSDLAASIRSLRDLITDKANLGAVRNTLQSLEQSIQSLSDILNENRKNILETTTNIRQATARANRLMDRAEGLVNNTDRNITETRKTIDQSLQGMQDQFSKVSSDIDRLANQMGKTADETTKMMASTRERLEPALDQLQTAGVTLNNILTGIREGKGTLGQLINNPGPFVDLDRTMRAIRRAILGRSGIEASVNYEDLVDRTTSPSLEKSTRP